MLEQEAKAKTSQLSIFVQLAVVILTLNLLVERGLQLYPIYSLGGNFDLWNTFMMSLKLPYFWTGLLVPAIYLFALWEASKFLRKFEMSKSFSSDLLLNLQNIGAELMYAAMAAILFAPTLEAWINQGTRNIKTNWDLEAVTIGMLGLVIKYVAQRARTVQHELDSFV